MKNNPQTPLFPGLQKENNEEDKTFIQDLPSLSNETTEASIKKGKVEEEKAKGRSY